MLASTAPGYSTGLGQATHTGDDMLDTKAVRVQGHELAPYPTSIMLRDCADEIDRLREDSHLLRIALGTTEAAATLYANQVAHWIEKHDALKREHAVTLKALCDLVDDLKMRANTRIDGQKGVCDCSLVVLTQAEKALEGTT